MKPTSSHIDHLWSDYGHTPFPLIDSAHPVGWAEWKNQYFCTASPNDLFYICFKNEPAPLDGPSPPQWKLNAHCDSPVLYNWFWKKFSLVFFSRKRQRTCWTCPPCGCAHIQYFSHPWSAMTGRPRNPGKTSSGPICMKTFNMQIKISVVCTWMLHVCG